MATIGTLLAGAVGGFGKKLDSSAFNLGKVDPDVSQMAAIAGNAAALPNAQLLASNVNLFNQQQLDILTEMASPGRAGIRSQEASVISDMIAGKVPKDVRNLVLSQRNAKNVGGGYGGYGMGFEAEARDLGLTSLGIIKEGISAATQWLAQSQTAPLYNLGNMFQSPDKRYQFDVEERNTQFNVNFAKKRNEAAPTPFNQALGQAFIEDEKALMSMVGSAAGMLGCWVAREVYGSHNPLWLSFRAWMFEDAPADLRDFYFTHGPAIARHIRHDPAAKSRIRGMMDNILATA